MSDSWLSSLIAKHATSGVLPDSNLLFLYLVGSLDPKLVGELKGTREYNIDDFRILSQFLSRFSVILTTPNIMTEVSNLAGKLRQDIKLLFRILVGKAISVMHEEYIATQEAAAHSLYERLGVTDATIGMLADRGVLVLTNDLDLAIMLEKLPVGCIHYTRILRPITLGVK